MSAVILHRVLNYLPGEEIDLGFEKVKYWLKKGGKIYIMVLSSERVDYRQQILPEYEKRKKNGDLWPGMYLDVSKYLPEQAYALPDKLHIMDKEVLQKALERHGFEIERIGYVSMQGFGITYVRWKRSCGVQLLLKQIDGSLLSLYCMLSKVTDLSASKPVRAC